jgi:putative phosphoribosyl transferase
MPATLSARTTQFAMHETTSGTIRELPSLRNCTHVFRDREHAGEVLAQMLRPLAQDDAIVLAIPAGGVPVAAAIARSFALPLDVIPVSKILLPWTTEAGFGAVAFDGSVYVDAAAVARFGLTGDDVRASTDAARSKVQRRMRRLRGEKPLAVRGRTVIVVDDGIAAGSTVRAAVAALRKLEPSRILIAVPTGHAGSLATTASDVDAIYCANIREGVRFAVADAYVRWTDVTDEDAEKALRSASQRQGN